jgi:endonuclease-3
MPKRQATAPTAGLKEPFDIDEVFRRLRQAVRDLPKAAMFDLRDRVSARRLNSSWAV